MKVRQNLRYPITIFVILFLFLIIFYDVIHYEKLDFTSKAYSVLLISLVAGFYFWLMFFVILPLEEIRKNTAKILDGNHKIHLEIGGNANIIALADQINDLNAHIIQAAYNIHDIKDGKAVNLVDKNDILSTALLDMQIQFEEIKLKEFEQNWVMTGLAKFVEILKNDSQNIEILYKNILSSLMDYLQAVQGGLFLVEENENETFLELAVSYAYQKEISPNTKIYKGEGLLGQAFASKKTIHLAQVPENYFEVGSGLGSAKANNLLILPLLLNQKVYGILEIYSFKAFKNYELEFLKKLAQSLASTIADSQNVKKIKKLFEDSVEKSEELSSQEEEMRQNLEELIATQEEMHQKQLELEENNKKMKAGESVLTKALQKAKEKEMEVKEKTAKLAENEFLLSQKVKELDLIRTEIEMRNEDLEFANKKLQNNEAILKKAFLKVKEAENKFVEKQNNLMSEISEKELIIKQLTEKLIELETKK